MSSQLRRSQGRRRHGRDNGAQFNAAFGAFANTHAERRATNVATPTIGVTAAPTIAVAPIASLRVGQLERAAVADSLAPVIDAMDVVETDAAAAQDTSNTAINGRLVDSGNGAELLDFSAPLQAIRAQFTPEGMLMNSRSPSCRNSTQAENIRLIVWLHFNKPEWIVTSFNQELDDLEASVDYSPITNPTRGYRYRGKKSVATRKTEYKAKVLADHIGSTLGPYPGFAEHPTVDLDSFTSDPKVYCNYLSTKEKADGNKMKPGVYTGYRSTLTNLFRRYRYVPHPQYVSELKMRLDGLVKLANLAVQNGGVSLHMCSKDHLVIAYTQ